MSTHTAEKLEKLAHETGRWGGSVNPTFSQELSLAHKRQQEHAARNAEPPIFTPYKGALPLREPSPPLYYEPRWGIPGPTPNEEQTGTAPSIYNRLRNFLSRL